MICYFLVALLNVFFPKETSKEIKYFIGKIELVSYENINKSLNVFIKCSIN